MIVWKRYSIWCVMLCECIRTLCDRLKTTCHKHDILLTIYSCCYHHTTLGNSVYGLKTVCDYLVTPIMQIKHFATASQLKLIRSVVTASSEFAITSRIVRNLLVIYMRNLVRSEGTAIFATPHFYMGSHRHLVLNWSLCIPPVSEASRETYRLLLPQTLPTFPAYEDSMLGLAVSHKFH